MYGTYAERALKVVRYLQDASPQQFGDPYAALRHALFLTDALLSGVELGEPDVPLAEEGKPGPLDPLTRLSLFEFAWGQALRSGRHPTPDLINHLTHEERAALLRGAVRSQVAVDTDILLDQVGMSDTTDALIRDAMAVWTTAGPLADLDTRLRRKFQEVTRQRKSRAQVTLLDIAAAHRIPILEAPEVVHLLQARGRRERLFTALLRYTSALQLDGVLETLHDMLDREAELSLAQRFALIDALAQIGDPASQPVIERLAARLATASAAGPHRIMCQYLETTLAAARSLEATPPHDGLVIAQFMFQGQIGRAGKGNSGGLGVFLATLGDALAELHGIAQVYTLVLLNAQQARDEPPLLIEQAPRHTIVHVPICCSHQVTQYQMMVQEYAIRTALERVMALYCIRPDVFHIRYSDNGSRAAAQVARRMGKKVVFTITTDPHRTMSANFGKPRLGSVEARSLLSNLHKVTIADQLLDLADGLIVMPNSAGIAPLVSYFPQLVLDPETRAKPLRAIAEGIQVIPDGQEDLMEKDTLLHLVCHDEARQSERRLDPGFSNRPIMLNVGRLHPIKQQPLLVQAWAESGLWRDYNLVLIGGQAENPTRIERKMGAQIEATLARYPGARDRFCFLPAMPNDQLRRLERSIVQLLPSPRPHVYACSSVKEEFGIAVLEAMAAGFLAFGPQAGGLSSYIETGRNGFLIDTGTMASIADGLTSVLRGDSFTNAQLRGIAAEGTRTVRERFDIRTTAAAFARFYQEIAG
jgi:glycosyltransferase involved in cell wall biosynthesis